VKQLKRNQVKNPSKEALLLKRMRQEKNYSIRKAADEIGRSSTWLNHLEQGRFDPRPQDYELVASLFELNLQQLNEKVAAISNNELIDILEECILMIRHLPQNKLNAVYQILKVF